MEKWKMEELKMANGLKPVNAATPGHFQFSILQGTSG